MVIKFENYGRFYCSLAYLNNDVIDYGNINTLADCADFIEYKMGQDPCIILGLICDADTGEVVATFEREPEEPDWDDCDNDMGFDPYMGCYTDDC